MGGVPNVREMDTIREPAQPITHFRAANPCSRINNSGNAQKGLDLLRGE